MKQHARKPAIAALLLAFGLGTAGLAATGQLHRASGSTASVGELERAIAAHPDAPTWAAYGDALRAQGRYAAAAEAYQRSLALDPSPRAVQINAAVALAQANEADAFFAYLTRLTITDAKVAADLVGRPELAPLHGDPRFALAAATARGQAAD